MPTPSQKASENCSSLNRRNGDGPTPTPRGASSTDSTWDSAKDYGSATKCSPSRCKASGSSLSTTKAKSLLNQTKAKRNVWEGKPPQHNLGTPDKEEMPRVPRGHSLPRFLTVMVWLQYSAQPFFRTLSPAGSCVYTHSLGKMSYSVPHKPSQQSGCWASLCQAALVPFSHSEQGWCMLGYQIWSSPPCSYSPTATWVCSRVRQQGIHP